MGKRRGQVKEQQVPPLPMPLPSGRECSGRNDKLYYYYQPPCLRLLHLRLRFLRFAFQGTLQGLIESGLGFFIFRLRDLTLPAFDFELEEFFF